MPIIVRPPREAIVFRTANYVLHETDVYKLFTSDPDKGGGWVATVIMASGVIISPAATGVTALDAALEDVNENIRQCNPWYLQKIKRALKKFNAKKRQWRK